MPKSATTIPPAATPVGRVRSSHPSAGASRRRRQLAPTAAPAHPSVLVRHVRPSPADSPTPVRARAVRSAHVELPFSHQRPVETECAGVVSRVNSVTVLPCWCVMCRTGHSVRIRCVCLCVSAEFNLI